MSETRTDNEKRIETGGYGGTLVVTRGRDSLEFRSVHCPSYHFRIPLHCLDRFIEVLSEFKKEVEVLDDDKM